MRKVGLALSLVLIAAACNASPASPESTGDEPSQDFAPNADALSESQGTGSDVDRDWEKLTIAEQRKVVFVDQHVEAARDLMARGLFHEARAEAARASDLDPDNLEVKRLLTEISAMLGDTASEPGALAEELGARYELKVQQLRSEAEEYLRRGDLLAARGDYPAAIAEYTLCLDSIRWAPYAIDWGGLREEAEAQLAQAREKRDQSEAQNRLAAEQDAYARIKAQEALEAERRTQRVATMLKASIAAFERGDYESAQEIADRVLAEDPRNARATDLRDASFRAGREQFRADFLARKREQYARWQEEIQELLVPWTGVITLPEAATWQANSDLRRGRGSLLDASADPSEALLREQLATTMVPGLQIVEVESLREVVATVQTLTDLPLVVDPAAEAAAFDAAVIFNIRLTNPMPAINVLDLVAELAGPEVAWTIRHEAVVFTTQEKVRGDLVIKNHTVHDLTFGLTDFLGPRIDKLRLLDELEDDDGGGPFGGLGERAVIIEPDQLSNLVTENVAKDSWDGDGVSIDIFDGGNLVIVQTAEVQRQVVKFLEDLRLFSSSMVTIESKFMTVQDNWIQEIGVEFRGIDNPGIPFTDLDDVTNGGEDQASLGLDNGGTGTVNNAAGAPSAGFFYDDGEDGDFKGHTSNIFENALGSALSNIGGLTAQWSILDDAQISVVLRMIEKSSKVELINDQVLSVQNTQRAYVTVINQRAYIQDFDVEVAQFEAIADPQINILIEGIVLDVRPTIHHNRKYLTLELQPTVAKVVAIRPFSTGLGSNTSPVEFQLPELEVQSVFTTAVIPDGGSVLLGGLSRIRQIERRAETPWLANIPLVGILFKEEGYNDEKSSLMVMIRAWITDVREELRRLER